MNINEIRCDNCHKTVDAPPGHFNSPPGWTTAVRLGQGYFDFCGEDCLRKFLLKRNGGFQHEAADYLGGILHRMRERDHKGFERIISSPSTDLESAVLAAHKFLEAGAKTVEPPGPNA